jgi:site-specific recombinase XerD
MEVIEQARCNALYHKHVRALKLKGHADKTIDAYSRAVRRLTEYLGRCPDEVTKDELDAYFARLLETHSWSTIKLDRNGIRFFYEEVLAKTLPWINFAQAPKTQRLPDILTHNEIAAIINVTQRFDFRCYWFVTYSLGLRLSETLHLEVGDIDAERQFVHVRRGKGHKDRFVIMPAMTLRVLRKLWCSHRHPRFLFPGRKAAQAAQVMDRGNVQKGFKRAVTDAGIRKRVSVHSLRHSYATHLMESGLTLSAIQHQLGHACPKTTARYVRMTEKIAGDAQAMIDALVSDLASTLRALPTCGEQ